MATRFYVGAQRGDSPVYPTFHGSWEFKLEGWITRMGLIKQAGFGGFGTSAGEDSTSICDCATAMFVSDTLATQQITGTVQAQVLCREDDAAADGRAQMLVRVISQYGDTERGVALAHSGAALSSEFVAEPTAMTNRTFPLGGAASLTTVQAEAGDRLVVEMGWRAHNVSGSFLQGYLTFNAGGSTDLPVDQTTTDSSNAWIEFSMNITFEDVQSDLTMYTSERIRRRSRMRR